MFTFQSNDGICVFGYSNYEFVGSPDDTKFTSGHVFTLAGGVNSWKC